MRSPNFKVDWILPQTLAGLTHFHAEITSADIMGVFEHTHALLQKVEKEFHILIDNRLAPLPYIYSLIELQALSPVLNHPWLRYVVIVKPNHLALGSQHMDIEVSNGVLLKNVSTVQEGMDFLVRQGMVSGFEAMDLGFFPE
jgi:hypothetical protein